MMVGGGAEFAFVFGGSRAVFKSVSLAPGASAVAGFRGSGIVGRALVAVFLANTRGLGARLGLWSAPPEVGVEADVG